MQLNRLFLKYWMSLLGIAICCIYMQTVWFGFVNWDDERLIVLNPLVTTHSFASLWRIFLSFDPELYTPLSILSFRVQHWLFGLQPEWFHLVNVLLHFINVVLVQRLTMRLSGHKTIGIFCALLFAVHPLNTEVVAWVSARKDLLVTLFTLLSLITFNQFRERDDIRFYCWSMICFVVALFCKPSAIAIPVLMVLMDLYKNRTMRRSFIIYMPFLAMSILFGMIALVGKAPRIAELTDWPMIQVWSSSILFTLWKFVLPINLSIVYPVADPQAFWHPYILALTELLLFAVVLIAFFARRVKHVAFGVFFFLVAIAPALLTLSHGEVLYISQDRFAYIPMIGLIYATCMGVWFLAKHTSSKACITLGLMICVVFAMHAWQRTQDWRSSEALFKSAIRVYPGYERLYDMLDTTYVQQGRIIERGQRQ